MKTFIGIILFVLAGHSALAQPCMADFNWALDSYNPARVNFTSTSTGTNLSYLWTFTPGNTNTAANPAFVFKENASHNVCLLVQSQTDTACHETKCKTINITNLGVCRAQFSFSRDTVNKQKITFQNMSFGDSATYLWAFGDGTYSSLKNPDHLFPAIGTYNVCLTAMKASTGCSSTFCYSLNLQASQGPCAFVLNINPAAQNYILIPANFKMRYNWDMGDGTILKGINLNIISAYQYEFGGSYTVCVFGQDTIDLACKMLNCQLVQVSQENARNQCLAKFDIQTQTLSKIRFNPRTMFTTDSLSFFWTFGDGDTSTERNPVHQYRNNGLVNICLHINGQKDSCSKTFCQNFFLADPALGNLENDMLESAKVYPNPFQAQIGISIGSTQKGKLQASLFDLEGRKCEETEFDLGSGENNFAMETADLPNGVYLLKLSTNGAIAFKRVVK